MKAFCQNWLELHPEWKRRERWNRVLMNVALGLPIVVIWIALMFYQYYVNGGR